LIISRKNPYQIKIKSRDWLIEFNLNFKRLPEALNYKMPIEFASKTSRLLKMYPSDTGLLTSLLDLLK